MLDEFGREIPTGSAAAATGGHNPSPFFTNPSQQPSNQYNGNAIANNPLLLNGELSTRRGDDGGSGNNGIEQHRHRVVPSKRDSWYGSSSSAISMGGAAEADASSSAKVATKHGPRGDSRDGDDDRSSRRSTGGGGGSGTGGGRRRRERSRSDLDEGGGSSSNRNHHNHRSSSSSSQKGSSSSQGSSSSSRVYSHPSEAYTTIGSPSDAAWGQLLCQFLWKKELESVQAREWTKSNDEKISRGEKDDDDDDDDVVLDEATDSVAPVLRDDNIPPPLFDSIDTEEVAYREYNAKYCLNYVQKFFNKHIDDPWFRLRLSPLEAIRCTTKERKRASAEANEMKREILQSLEDATSGVIPKKDPDCPEYLGSPKCNFIASCRLGVGTKPSSTTSGATNNGYHYHNHHQRGGDLETMNMPIVLQGEDRNRIERHAKSHLHSFIRGECCVKIMDVPPNVTDDQIRAAMAEHGGYDGFVPPTSVWSDPVRIPTLRTDTDMAPYHRIAYAVFPSSSAKDAMLESLHHNNGGKSNHKNRKGLPNWLDLDIDCTDVYGRRDIDADGRGGAPPSFFSGGKKKKMDEDAIRLPTKRCTVHVSTSLLASSQPVSVLSAALSSRERIPRDREDTATIARVLDEVRGIEAGSRLADLLQLLYPGDELHLVDDEDILDLSIAYLRRVHLFSFYNGCIAAKDVGNVLSFSHPAGTIHLRLKGADDILAKAAAEEERNNILYAEDGDMTTLAAAKDPESGTTDMLVKRLNDSITRALETVQILAQRGGPTCVIDEETDAAAKEIEHAEQISRQEWITNHSRPDEDGRARCSFHFCQKLFKDIAFLHKHLQKKHVDHLRAELAKCHDGPMMMAWDAWDRNNPRPVPPVLIDCGSKYGLIPSMVTESDSLPISIDPEPDLWREDQRRIEEEEEWKHREREAMARAEEEQIMQRRREHEQSNTNNGGEKRKSNFVDPDDMVEEKVELSFENIVVAPPPKKKKKKKSLL